MLSSEDADKEGIRPDTLRFLRLSVHGLPDESASAARFIFSLHFQWIFLSSWVISFSVFIIRKAFKHFTKFIVNTASAFLTAENPVISIGYVPIAAFRAYGFSLFHGLIPPKPCRMRFSRNLTFQFLHGKE